MSEHKRNMKYITYLLLAAFSLFAKIIGLAWVFICIPFRAYARNVVYNYVLQHDIDLKRLRERHPERTETGWKLHDIHNTGMEGFVQYRQVSKLEYMLVLLLLWGWLDDDANHDTYDAGHIQRLLDENWWGLHFLPRSALRRATQSLTYGNTFDLGDRRCERPHFNVWAVLIWNTRNTAYNFAYLWEFTSNEEKTFQWSLGKWKFGWEPDWPIGNTKYWKLVVGKNW